MNKKLGFGALILFLVGMLMCGVVSADCRCWTKGNELCRCTSEQMGSGWSLSAVYTYICDNPCKDAGTVACGKSLNADDCTQSGCSSTGGTYCATGTCVSGVCVVSCITGSWVNQSNYRCNNGIRQRNQTRTVSPVACTTNQQWIDVPCSSGYHCDGVGACYSNTNINTTYWAKLDGSSISNADNGDTVLMIYGGYLLEGKTINYTVQQYNSSSLWYWPPSWFSRSWNDANKISSNKAYEFWKITNTDTKRFVVKTGNVQNTSGNLTINSNVNNSKPTIGPVNPIDGIKVSVNSSTRFNQTSYDEDDLLKITWDFGDGTTNYIVENYSSYINSSFADVKHNYTKSGVYYWTLTVEEMRAQPQKNSTSGVIYVLEEGVNVVPVISSPYRGQDSGTGWLTFNASETFVANCTTGQMSNKNFTTSDKLLNCSYLHAPKSLASPNFNNYYLTFNWTLGDGENRTGNWTDDNSYANVVFHYKYDIGGRHDINLNVEYGLK